MADRWVFHIPKRESLVLCLLRSHFFTLNIMVPHCRRILNLCLFQGLTVKNITQSIMQCEYLPISTVLESNTKTHDDFSIIKVLFKLAWFFFLFFNLFIFVLCFTNSCNAWFLGKNNWYSFLLLQDLERLLHIFIDPYLRSQTKFFGIFSRTSIYGP